MVKKNINETRKNPFHLAVSIPKESRRHPEGKRTFQVSLFPFQLFVNEKFRHQFGVGVWLSNYLAISQSLSAARFTLVQYP